MNDAGPASLRCLIGLLACAGVLLAGCTSAPDRSPGDQSGRVVDSAMYQLQNYPNGQLDALVRAPHHLMIIDLARDAGASNFTAEEIGKLRASGKKVLAYFEIGAIENFRPEYGPLKAGAADLLLNEVDGWPGEYFVRYWDSRWWEAAVAPRVDQALAAGFDGVYLDLPLAYEEIDLKLVPGENRETLGAKMVELIVRISQYAKRARPGFLVFPQNSPELQRHPGYTEAIDGIGMEELFFLATDQRCSADFCHENLEAARKLRRAGKTIVAIDYANRPENVAFACKRYREEGFVGLVTVKGLDRIKPPCPN